MDKKIPSFGIFQLFSGRNFVREADGSRILLEFQSFELCLKNSWLNPKLYTLCLYCNLFLLQRRGLDINNIHKQSSRFTLYNGFNREIGKAVSNLEVRKKFACINAGVY